MAQNLHLFYAKSSQNRHVIIILFKCNLIVHENFVCSWRVMEMFLKITQNETFPLSAQPQKSVHHNGADSDTQICMKVTQLSMFALTDKMPRFYNPAIVIMDTRNKKVCMGSFSIELVMKISSNFIQSFQFFQPAE